MPPTSEPASGSEIATAVIVRPRAISGRKRWRCSSVPKCISGKANIVLIPASSAQASEWRAISSRARQTMVRLPSGPPYFSGTQSCIRPMSPKIGISSLGKRSFSSISAAIGATCRAAIRRTLS